jgi:hypothetical protein
MKPKSSGGLRTHKPPKSPRARHNQMLECNKKIISKPKNKLICDKVEDVFLNKN